MTYDTYDNLQNSLGRKLTNTEWINLISENFEVSRSTAKEMLYCMLSAPKYGYGNREVEE